MYFIPPKTITVICHHHILSHSTKKPVTTMLTYPWKCTVLHCNHLGNTWKPLVLMTRHFDYCPSASEGDNQSVRSSAPVVSRCFPGGYHVKLYISRGRLAWWLLAFLHSVTSQANTIEIPVFHSSKANVIMQRLLHVARVQTKLDNPIGLLFPWTSVNIFVLQCTICSLTFKLMVHK